PWNRLGHRKRRELRLLRYQLRLQQDQHRRVRQLLVRQDQERLLDRPTIMRDAPLGMDYRDIIEEEAKKAGIRVYYHDLGAQWGRSDLGRKRIFIPTPKRFPSFFTCLHEIGHIMSNHHSWDRKPEYLWEYEAFSWAFNCCRRTGIEGPQRTVEYERSLIAEKVRAAVNGGSRMINRTVVSFIMKGDGEADPDIAFLKTNLSDKGTVVKS